MHSRAALGVALLILLLAGRTAEAEEDLKGSYQGRYEGNVNPQTGRTLFVHVTLVVVSVDSGKAHGTLSIQNGICQGEYAAEGTIQDNRLELETAKGSVLGCGSSKVRLSSGPGRLSGKFGANDIEMSKIRN